MSENSWLSRSETGYRVDPAIFNQLPTELTPNVHPMHAAIAWVTKPDGLGEPVTRPRSTRMVQSHRSSSVSNDMEYSRPSPNIFSNINGFQRIPILSTNQQGTLQNGIHWSNAQNENQHNATHSIITENNNEADDWVTEYSQPSAAPVTPEQAGALQRMTAGKWTSSSIADNSSVGATDVQTIRPRPAWLSHIPDAHDAMTPTSLPSSVELSIPERSSQRLIKGLNDAALKRRGPTRVLSQKHRDPFLTPPPRSYQSPDARAFHLPRGVDRDAAFGSVSPNSGNAAPMGMCHDATSQASSGDHSTITASQTQSITPLLPAMSSATTFNQTSLGCPSPGRSHGKPESRSSAWKKFTLSKMGAGISKLQQTPTRGWSGRIERARNRSPAASPIPLEPMRQHGRKLERKSPKIDNIASQRPKNPRDKVALLSYLESKRTSSDDGRDTNTIAAMMRSTQVSPTSGLDVSSIPVIETSSAALAAMVRDAEGYQDKPEDYDDSRIPHQNWLEQRKASEPGAVIVPSTKKVAASKQKLYLEQNPPKVAGSLVKKYHFLPTKGVHAPEVGCSEHVKHIDSGVRATIAPWEKADGRKPAVAPQPLAALKSSADATKPALPWQTVTSEPEDNLKSLSSKAKGKLPMGNGSIVAMQASSPNSAAPFHLHMLNENNASSTSAAPNSSQPITIKQIRTNMQEGNFALADAGPSSGLAGGHARVRSVSGVAFPESIKDVVGEVDLSESWFPKTGELPAASSNQVLPPKFSVPAGRPGIFKGAYCNVVTRLVKQRTEPIDADIERIFREENAKIKPQNEATARATVKVGVFDAQPSCDNIASAASFQVDAFHSSASLDTLELGLTNSGAPVTHAVNCGINSPAHKRLSAMILVWCCLMPPLLYLFVKGKLGWVIKMCSNGQWTQMAPASLVLADRFLVLPLNAVFLLVCILAPLLGSLSRVASAK